MFEQQEIPAKGGNLKMLRHGSWLAHHTQVRKIKSVIQHKQHLKEMKPISYINGWLMNAYTLHINTCIIL